MLGKVGRAGAVPALFVGSLAVGASLAAPSTPTAASVTSSWSVYHGDPQGTGVATTGATFRHASQAWSSPILDGQIYGEPLAASGRVFVATEADTVYALAANTGTILWSAQLGTAVPSSSLPCGDISPTVGITGTPVVDTTRSELFVVADELLHGVPQHHLVGLNVYTGAVELDQVVDPPGATPGAVLQRTGLNLTGGDVVVGFGGNYGDCGSYHGAIASVPEVGGTSTYYTIDAGVGQREGAVWMGGAAPEVDGSGNIWAAIGNGSSTTPSKYDGSDAVVELGSALNQIHAFAPSSWPTDNAHDLDLGSSAPALLGDGKVLQVGKSQTGYLLTGSSLGLQAATHVCTGDADGGDAVVGTVVYVGCQSGVEAVQTTPTLSVQWRATNGTAGPPIVAGGLVWSIGSTALFGIDPANGSPVVRLGVGHEANHFPTPSVADGLLLAPGGTDGNKVLAFEGSAGLPGTPAPGSSTAPPPLASYWEVATDGGVFSFGKAAFHGSMGGHPLNAPVVGIARAPQGGGYWEVAADGGIFSFGNAAFEGSMGGHQLSAPIVGVASTPTPSGYWEAGTDGGVFSFGDAAFHGSMGGRPLDAPIAGIAAAF